ncbi:hypothetical protein ASZ90_005229 [hydrocarbon metagenome]|uniref:Uncharacterized protein n=1 Tax=hydrocarbon metagenome TaxID=938273 RepID=A0A0W8FVL2_9ZZZZ
MIGPYFYNTGTSMIIITGSATISRSDSSDKIGDTSEEIGYLSAVVY